MEKITRLVLIAGLFIMGIILSIFTFENGVLMSVLSFLLVFLFDKKVKLKNFPLFLVIFSLLTKIIAVIVLDIPIQVDYKYMYDASICVINGDFSFVNTLYFSNWGYQLGHVLYQALMLMIFNNVLFLRILNCVFSTVITLLIYLILKKFTSEKSARIMSLVYCISLYPIYLNAILGNQPLSLMLILIGIYFLLTKKNDFVHLIVVGILIGLGNIERPEGIIYLLTIFIYHIFTLKNVKLILKNTAIIVLSYVVVTQAASFILIRSGVNEIGFKNNDPLWKFLVGFNYDYNGKINPEDYQYTVTKELEKETLINRLKDFNKMPNLFYQKIKILWLYDDLEDSFLANNTSQFSRKYCSNYIELYENNECICTYFSFCWYF